jgi:hypothetical protein
MIHVSPVFQFWVVISGRLEFFIFLTKSNLVLTGFRPFDIYFFRFLFL